MICKHRICNIIRRKRYKPAPQHTKSVDIIICVHNAYDDVKLCLEAVLKHTTQPYSIIIIDDGSGEQTRDYLMTVADNNENVTLIRNDTATGYGRAANIGMSASDADYRVLLNSDTIVTAGWIDKMIRCQTSSKNTGIVGPLSNTASWQSVPKITGDDGDWAHNEIPKELGLEKYAQMIESNSKRLYPQIPLLNGFCLLIHKSVIDKIGYFDEENFGSGFGEEDDFNIRAGLAGFRLAIADDTFIYHAQSKSFTDEGRHKNYAINGAKLRTKHGDALIDEYVKIMQENLYLKDIRDNISKIAQL